MATGLEPHACGTYPGCSIALAMTHLVPGGKYFGPGDSHAGVGARWRFVQRNGVTEGAENVCLSSATSVHPRQA